MGKELRQVIPKAVILAICVATLSQVIGSTWKGTLPVAQGQTIPWRTRTPTPGPTDIPSPTATWTALPTWTPLPTVPPATAVPVEQPTHTPLPPTAGPTQTGTPTGSQPSPTTPATATSTTTPTAPAPTPGPAALAFYILAAPLQAGPGDQVSFVARVANVGYSTAHDILLEAQIPRPLEMLQVDCHDCSVSQLPDRVTISAPQILPGDQLLVSITCQIASEALPGQTVKTAWKLAASEGEPQLKQVAIELPWAELPATGLHPEPGPSSAFREGSTTWP